MRYISFILIALISYQSVLASKEVIRTSVVGSEIEAKYPQQFKQLYEAYDQFIETQLDQVKSRSLTVWRQLARDYPDLYDARRMLAAHEGRSGNYIIAERIFRQILRERPDYLKISIDLAMTVYHQDRQDEAIAIFEQVISDKNVSIAELNNIANFYHEIRYWTKSTELYERLINELEGLREYEDSTLFYRFRLAGTYETYNQYKRAEKHHAELVKRKPEEAVYWGNYAQFIMRSYGDADRTIEYGERAIRLRSYPLIRYHVAYAYYAKWIFAIDNNLPNAEYYRSKGYALAKPSYPLIDRARRSRGTADAVRGMLLIYENQFQRDLVKENHSADVLSDYAYFLLFYQNDREQAYKYANMAYKRDKNDTTAFMLACAAYEIWKERSINGKKQEGERYLYRARKVYKDTEEVIKQLLKYKYTQHAGHYIKGRNAASEYFKKPESHRRQIELNHMKNFIGVYESDLYDRIEVQLRGDGLYLNVENRGFFNIGRPDEAYQIKTTLDGKDLVINFIKGPVGYYNHLNYRYDGVTTEYSKISGVHPGYYSNFVGTYSLDLQPVIKVTVTGNQLFVEKDNKREVLFPVDMRVIW